MDLGNGKLFSVYVRNFDTFCTTRHPVLLPSQSTNTRSTFCTLLPLLLYNRIPVNIPLKMNEFIAENCLYKPLLMLLRY